MLTINRELQQYSIACPLNWVTYKRHNLKMSGQIQSSTRRDVLTFSSMGQVPNPLYPTIPTMQAISYFC